MRWLRALRRAMDAARAGGRPVVLAGDLNMKARAEDSYWATRRVSIARIERLARGAGPAAAAAAAAGDGAAAETAPDGGAAAVAPDVARAAAAIAAVWPRVCAALRARAAQPTVTANSKTGETFHKWQCVVPLVPPLVGAAASASASASAASGGGGGGAARPPPPPEKRVVLGKPFASEVRGGPSVSRAARGARVEGSCGARRARRLDPLGGGRASAAAPPRALALRTVLFLTRARPGG